MPRPYSVLDALWVRHRSFPASVGARHASPVSTVQFNEIRKAAAVATGARLTAAASIAPSSAR